MTYSLTLRENTGTYSLTWNQLDDNFLFLEGLIATSSISGGTGPTGPQGSIGDQGFQGSEGPQGFQGPQGYNGIDGATGPQGFQGPTGGTIMGGGGWGLTGNSGTSPGTNFIGTKDPVGLMFKINNSRAGFIELSNTSVGYLSLASNTSGYNNVAIGVEALGNNSSGFNNISIGWLSSVNVSTGSNNVSLGQESLSTNSTGNNLIAIGSNSDVNADGYNNSATIGGIITSSNGIFLSNNYEFIYAPLNSGASGSILTNDGFGNGTWQTTTGFSGTYSSGAVVVTVVNGLITSVA
jgi:hypothetical protein